ncbi:hypothetical protein [Actinoplanes subtropicus]|nr:hypothetical protein [Actinoplanes subtropicus]
MFASSGSTCLTTAEAGVVRRLHDGAVTGRRDRLEPAQTWLTRRASS